MDRLGETETETMLQNFFGIFVGIRFKTIEINK